MEKMGLNPSLLACLGQISRLCYHFRDYRPTVMMAVFDRYGRTLLVQPRKSTEKAWMLPQGGVEKDEEILAALQRELRQETGITPEELGEINFLGSRLVEAPTGRLDRRGFKNGKLFFVFAARYHGDGILHLQAEEVSAYSWCYPLEIPARIKVAREEKQRLIEEIVQAAVGLPSASENAQEKRERKSHAV